MKKCSDCRNQQIQGETIKSYEVSYDEEGRVLPVPPIMRATHFKSVERCRSDEVARHHSHPFGVNGRGPVLTCREMRMNDCGKDAKLFEARVVKIDEHPKRTQFGRVRSKE